MILYNWRKYENSLILQGHNFPKNVHGYTF